MPRSRPASNPLSFHKPTGQHYVTRDGKRVYLGANREDALGKYHRMALGMGDPQRPPVTSGAISGKELANRFLETQQANWRNPVDTLRGYRDWLGRFLKDHPRLKAGDFTVEMFAAWKLSLKRRGYSAQSINHYLSAVRALFAFAEDVDIIEHPPKLRRVKNDRKHGLARGSKKLYTEKQLGRLLAGADIQMRLMVLLGINCGFGPKDIHDLEWTDFCAGRATLPRSKTGVCQTFALWPETLQAIDGLRLHRDELIARMAKRSWSRSDGGRLFITKFWRPWSKDAVAGQFRKLCAKAGVPCYGFYRLRHCASTAISLVANPHVQRRFMRHSQLQQQVTYTHTPDAAVDAAVMKARAKLLGEEVISDQGNDRGQTGVA
jgi:integrase